MIGHFIDAVVRHVADRNATRRGRIEVHVVHADAVAHDDLRLPHAGDDIGIHRGELSNDRIGIGNQLRQLGRGPLLFPRDDFVTQRTKNALLDIEARKRVVGDRDLHLAACGRVRQPLGQSPNGFGL